MHQNEIKFLLRFSTQRALLQLRVKSADSEPIDTYLTVMIHCRKYIAVIDGHVPMNVLPRLRSSNGIQPGIIFIFFGVASGRL